MPIPSTDLRRAGWFTVVLLLLNLVGDGWTGRPGPLSHQLLLLPITAFFLFATWQLLKTAPRPDPFSWTSQRALLLVLIFEVVAAALYFYAGHHFAPLGYRSYPVLAVIVFAPLLVGLARASFSKVSPFSILLVTLASYCGGMILAIKGFPLNYLRSDMLAVILWADQAILRHADPYTTLYVGGRVYDFPYLPGMMVGSLPFTAVHLDIRFGSMAYIIGMAALLYWTARRDRKLEVVAVIALFVLCPFLQYRHELYLQPHWFVLMLAFVLLQRRHFAWGAFVFGISMAIYQFSWIMFPFLLLNGWRRRGWAEPLKLALCGALGALLIVGPFLASATKRMASNTVGQWGLLPHAMADPINLSYWVTYLIHPDKLLRLQALLMVAIFAYCLFRGRCGDLADTLRAMTAALTVFLLFNVIVDGYFYLMLLAVMLPYTCVANGWLADPGIDSGDTQRTASEA